MLRAGVQNNKPQDRPYGEKRTIPITPHTSLWGAAPAGLAIVTGATEGPLLQTLSPGVDI